MFSVANRFACSGRINSQNDDIIEVITCETISLLPCSRALKLSSKSPNACLIKDQHKGSGNDFKPHTLVRLGPMPTGCKYSTASQTQKQQEKTLTQYFQTEVLYREAFGREHAWLVGVSLVRPLDLTRNVNKSHLRLQHYVRNSSSSWPDIVWLKFSQEPRKDGGPIGTGCG